jgi:hypothetical protein
VSSDLFKGWLRIWIRICSKDLTVELFPKGYFYFISFKRSVTRDFFLAFCRFFYEWIYLASVADPDLCLWLVDPDDLWIRIQVDKKHRIRHIRSGSATLPTGPRVYEIYENWLRYSRVIIRQIRIRSQRRPSWSRARSWLFGTAPSPTCSGGLSWTAEVGGL